MRRNYRQSSLKERRIDALCRLPTWRGEGSLVPGRWKGQSIVTCSEARAINAGIGTPVTPLVCFGEMGRTLPAVPDMTAAAHSATSLPLHVMRLRSCPRPPATSFRDWLQSRRFDAAVAHTSSQTLRCASLRLRTGNTAPSIKPPQCVGTS